MAVIDSTAVINGVRMAEQGSDPSSPASGYQIVYVKSGGVYIKTSGGAVTGPLIASGAGSGWKYPADGRLTLATGVPVTTTDQAAKTTLYYTPYVGDQISLYDGASAWNIRAFTELSISLGGLTAGLPYDVFCYDNSGTATLELLAWASATARATALAYQNGVLVKTGATTRRYLGTICITGTTGQCEDSLTKRLVWNYYNRVPRSLNKDAASSHAYTGVYRAWNNDTANKLEYVCGVVEGTIWVGARIQTNQSNSANTWETGLMIDSFTVIAAGNIAYASGHDTLINWQHPSVTFALQLGYHYYGMFEASASTSSTFAEIEAWASLLG